MSLACNTSLLILHSYNQLLEKKDLEILKLCERLEGGLTKLSEATEQLNELNKKLAVQKVMSPVCHVTYLRHILTMLFIFRWFTYMH